MRRGEGKKKDRGNQNKREINGESPLIK